MSLFPDPIPTEVEIVNRQMRELNAWADGTVTIIKERINEMFVRFWTNPIKLAEAYGTSASALFQKLALLEGVLQQIDPSYQPGKPPEKYSYELHDDGTVTIRTMEGQG